MIVLIVDDNEDNIYSMALLLELYYNAQIYTATSAKYAKKILDDISIDLMLLDIQMPETNGLEFASSLREDPKYQSLPIIFVSGVHMNKTIRNEITKSRAFGFIEKPIDNERFKGVIDTVKIYCMID